MTFLIDIGFLHSIFAQGQVRMPTIWANMGLVPDQALSPFCHLEGFEGFSFLNVVCVIAQIDIVQLSPSAPLSISLSG